MTWRRGEALPITLVSGFAGAGKSSLLNHVRAEAGARHFAFLFDDGEKDLFNEIEDVLAQGLIEAIFIECAAPLEPYAVAEHLLLGDEEGPPPEGAKPDTLVTVVDASTLLDDCLHSGDLAERGLMMDEEDDRAVAEVVIEQIEFADVIVLNKTDRIGEEELAQVEALAARLNPRAKRVLSVHGRVPVERLTATGLFDLNETDDGAGWLAELQGEFDEVGEVNGVTSFTYIERRPFHPIRFNELLADLDVEGLVRAKGSLWIATRHHEIGVWSLAGPASVLSYGGAWFAATPAREWPQDTMVRAEIMQDWVPPFGDRRQEIAFIGVNMDEGEIRSRLDDCLLTDAEMKDGPHSWDSIPDPLPDWHEETDSDVFGGGGPDTLT